MFFNKTIKTKSRFNLAECVMHIDLQGFTLAEVLITLGIIGVVAAITIPNLMVAYKAKKMRSQFLKSYSVIQQAFRQMEVDDVWTSVGVFNWGANSVEFALVLIQEKWVHFMMYSKRDSKVHIGVDIMGIHLRFCHVQKIQHIKI